MDAIVIEPDLNRLSTSLSEMAEQAITKINRHINIVGFSLQVTLQQYTLDFATRQRNSQRQCNYHIRVLRVTYDV